MNVASYVPAVLIGLAYTAWPIIGRAVGVRGEWLAVTVALGTAIPMLALSGPHLTSQAKPASLAIGILFCTALINGVAQNFHSWKAADPTIKVGIFSLVVYVVMVVGAPLLDRLINGTELSYSQIVAVLLAVGAVYFAL